MRNIFFATAFAIGILATANSALADSPALPLNFSAVASTTARQVNLSWSAIGSANAKYLVVKDIKATGTFNAVVKNTSLTSVTDARVDANKVYYYRIKSCVPAGELLNCSNYSDPPVSVITYPDAPRVNIPKSTTTSSILLSWLPVKGLSYKIEKSLVKDSAYSVLNTFTSDTKQYVDTNLNVNTQYFYKFTAIGSGGNSMPTIMYGRTLAEAPTGLSATAAGNVVSLTWAAPASASGLTYSVYMNSASTGNFNRIVSSNITGTSYKQSGLAPNRQYFYKIKSCNSGVCSALSNSAFAYTAPAGIRGANVLALDYNSSPMLVLYWQAVDSKTSYIYNIYKSSMIDGAYTKIGSTRAGVTSFADGSGLMAGTTYYYRISAIGINNLESMQSSPIKGTTLAQ